ncbi:ADP-ribosylglycohydrolase family protein [Lachnospiraceae bacterium OttesenSCG-928-D06]|nr:ADP-ribosylglycohydrolase family protein [Lachnospiraceae bacterium OttesenSCG-928-D06]
MLNKDKLMGGVLGLAVGDALGVPVEFKDRACMNVNPISGMTGYGTYNQPVGTWSDDTSMTIATLDTMCAGGLSLGRIMDAFLKWYTNGCYTPFGECFDIGGTTKKAINNYFCGEMPINCGLDDEMSNGNGSLMRMLPMVYYVYLRHGTEITPQTVDEIYKVSSLTHAHIVSKVSCVYYVYLGIYLMEQGEELGLKGAIEKAIEAVEDYYYEAVESGDIPCIIDVNGMGSLVEVTELGREGIKSSGYVVDSLEASIWCLHTTYSYREAVLRAVNLGGDTDTIGAITGSLAGIYYGLAGIPKEWLEELQKRSYLEDIVERFYTEYK